MSVIYNGNKFQCAVPQRSLPFGEVRRGSYYDALNRPVTITQPDTTVETRVYAKGGMLNAITYNNTNYITGITYNARGQRESIYYGNNSKTQYTYNTQNFRLIRLLTTRNSGADVLQDLNYTYDAVGNITQVTDNAQQTFYFNNQVVAPTGSYTYDALYRLIAATGRELTSIGTPTDVDFVNTIGCPNPAANAMQNYSHAYAYDELGNMTNNNGTIYTYATANNQLTLTGFTYDAHGNTLTMPHLTSMAWDYLDQLHSAGNGTFTSYYNYDAEGKRTRKVVDKGTVVEHRYYFGEYEIYDKYVSGVLDTERTTVYLNDEQKRFVTIETLTTVIPAVVTVRYQYDNHLGSACLELDGSSAIITYEEYYPFGVTSYRSGRTQAETSLKRYKYCGKERDEETGLYYYGMRYYAAWICRFVSVDPLQFKYPHYTPYQYAGNKPITYIDLDGGEEKKPGEGKKIKTTTDAGHGVGKQGGIIDPGAIDDKNYEKDYALKVEEQIDIWLKEFGVDNMRTREGDLTVDGNKINFRWKLANENNSDVFVSIHLDWSKGIDNLVAIYEPNQTNSAESKKLAESIISNSKTLVPSKQSIKTSDETAVKTIAVLREFKGKAGVLLELGSIGSVSTRELIDKKASEIGKEIAIGIYKYLYNTNPHTKAERAKKEMFYNLFKEMLKNNIIKQDETKLKNPIYFITNEKPNN